MSKQEEERPTSAARRVLRFAVSTALVVAPLAVGCGGGQSDEGATHVNTGHHTNTAHVNPGPAEEEHDETAHESVGGEVADDEAEPSE